MQAEFERRLQERLKDAHGAAAAEADRIRAEVEEEEARKRRELEDRAAALEAQLEAQLLAAQRANDEREEERRRREAEAGSSKGALESLQQEARAAIELQQRQEAELQVTRSNLEAELEKMRAQLATIAEAPTVRLRERLKGEAGGGMLYETAEVMISMAEARLARHAQRGRRGDMAAVKQILETLPAPSACNDLRALTDLEGASRTLFQEMQVRSALIALDCT
jgi:DNA repair exonuclease SbcCD ATPase subunit